MHVTYHVSAHKKEGKPNTRATTDFTENGLLLPYLHHTNTEAHTCSTATQAAGRRMCGYCGMAVWRTPNGSSRRNMDRIRMAKNCLPKHAHTHIVVRHTACAIVRRKVHAGTTHGFNCRKCCAVLERWVLCSPNPLPEDSTHDKTSKIAKAKAIKWQIR